MSYITNDVGGGSGVGGIWPAQDFWILRSIYRNGSATVDYTNWSINLTRSATRIRHDRPWLEPILSESDRATCFWIVGGWETEGNVTQTRGSGTFSTSSLIFLHKEIDLQPVLFWSTSELITCAEQGLLSFGKLVATRKMGRIDQMYSRSAFGD